MTNCCHLWRTQYMCSNQAHHLQYHDTALALDSKSLEPLHKLRINNELFWSPFRGGITDCTRKQQQTIDTLTTLNSLNSRWITCLRIACTAWVHCWRKGSSHIHWKNALARSFDEISDGKTSGCWWCLIARWQEGDGVYLELHEGPLHVSTIFSIPASCIHNERNTRMLGYNDDGQQQGLRCCSRLK
jgi:hypothetical protein